MRDLRFRCLYYLDCVPLLESWWRLHCVVGSIVFCTVNRVVVADGSVSGQSMVLFGFFIVVVVKGLRSFGDVTRELVAVLTRCFTVTFVCRLKRRVGAVLGIQHYGTGDACCCLFA